MKQAKKWPPHTKVSAGAIAELVTAVLVVVAWWLETEYGLNVPFEVLGAASIVLMAVVPPIVSYWVRSSPLDTPVPITKEQ